MDEEDGHFCVTLGGVCVQVSAVDSISQLVLSCLFQYLCHDFML